ncbi:tigger transposable element-derived protein 1-like protein [Trichonephila clavipes]|nr:tigger transposable element-derived protein 1-like protein [Trichonephila clavipes]
MHGESASADKEAAEKYFLKFQEFVETEGYRPQQIFNYDETGLLWKHMPNRTYITKDEKNVPGHKPIIRGSPSLGDGGNQGDTPEIMDEILTTARDLELEVNEDDIEQLIMGHEEELMTEELQEILNEEHQGT